MTREDSRSEDASAPPADACTALQYLVEGMDCADCARHVDALVARTPGAADARVNFTTQTLGLVLDESRTPRRVLEGRIRALGYEPRLRGSATREPGTAGGTRDDAAERLAFTDNTERRADVAEAEARPWYATRPGRRLLAAGALLVAAFGLGRITPPAAYWAYVAATAIGVWPLARRAVAAARLGNPFSINALVSLAAVGALLIGEAPEGALVVFLFAVGELLEGIAAGRARAGIRALAALAPKSAFLVEDGAGDVGSADGCCRTGCRTGEPGNPAVREVPAASLRLGQVVQVRPGGRVPADGTILTGTSGLDDSPVTGESVPVTKGPGDTVFAGSINTEGVLTVRVDRDAADNTIARIIHLVEEAESSKAPTARFIDRFSRLYTPGVVLVSALVMLVPPLAASEPWGEWLYKGIALLLIGCPCALVLSTPAAITAGISAGARHGLLIKGGAALETIGAVRTIAFDKTGTLTDNRPRVTDLVPLAVPEPELLALAAAVETGSSHPLATAILARAATARVTVPTAQDAKALPGRAATALVAGRQLAVGSPRYAAEVTAAGALPPDVAVRVEALERDGKTVVALLEHTPAGGRVLGLLAIRDEPRPDARAAVADLGALGVRSLMLTGDNARTGAAIAGDLGLDVQAELMPEDKLRLIDTLRGAGSVAMVGDGINDAPALARADVGIAMGGGTDVALETANAALLRNTVTGVADLVRLSRATMRNIHQNVALALGLKAVFLITTLLGVTGLWMAILADTGATALVTANALRLLGFNPRRGHEPAPAPQEDRDAAASPARRREAVA